MLYNWLFQLPNNETDISLWLPLIESSNPNRSKYSECEIYIDPSNQSLGTQSCIFGYQYAASENEWNIVTEVKILTT